MAKKKKHVKKKAAKPTLKLPVGILDYNVYLTPTPRLSKGDDIVCGFCRYDDRHIEVCDQLSAQGMYLTLWHEYFHGLFHELGYPNSRENESFVEALAQNLAHAAPVIVNYFKVKTQT